MEQLLHDTAGSMIPSWDCCLGSPELGLAGHVPGLALHCNCRGRELTASWWIFNRQSDSKGRLWVLNFFCVWEIVKKSPKAKS